MSKKNNLSTYFTIGLDAGSGLFVERTANNGSVTKTMNPKVFKGAVYSADKKLKEVSDSFLKSKTHGSKQ